MEKNIFRGILCSLSMAIIWGLSFLSIKVAVTAIPPMTIGLIRFVIATIILIFIYLIKKTKPRLEKKDTLLMIASGLVGTTIYFIGENNGVMRLSASEASILVSVIPVMAMICERVFLKAKLSLVQYLGAVLSVVGIALMVAESLKVSTTVSGYFFMALAAVCWVAYAFMTKPLLKKYDSLEITFWQSLFGAIGFIPFTFFEKINWPLVDLSVILNLVYLGVFCSAIGYLLYIEGLNILGAGVSSVFLNLIPVVTVIASFLIFKEKLSVFQISGGAVAIIGVYMTSLFAPKKK